MTKPTVSVCIPSYNHARFLPAALNSILAQTRQDFEIILVDDGSTDQSLTVARAYEQDYLGKIHVYTHPGGINRGISATCNLAVEKSQGEYLAWLGSDDMWYPDKLQAQLELLKDHPEVSLVYGTADIIDADGRKTGEQVGRDITPDPIPLLIRANYLPALTVMHARNCHSDLGLYDESLLYSDWEMWLRIISHFLPVFLARPLGQYRVHSSNVFAGKERTHQLHNDYLVLEKIRQNIDAIGGRLCHVDNRFLLELRLASLVSHLDDHDLMKNHLDAAAKINPSFFSNIPALMKMMDDNGFDFRSFPKVRQYLPTPSGKAGRQFDAEYEAREAFLKADEDIPAARHHAIKAITRNPTWIFNRSIAKIFLRSLIGRKYYRNVKAIFSRGSVLPNSRTVEK